MEAYAWYEEQQVGLGEEFLRCVDACIQSILRHPKLYETKFKNYRRGLVRRFPYGVFYEYIENENTVMTVMEFFIVLKILKNGMSVCHPNIF